MNNAAQTQPRKNTPADSFFGMALAQAFTGFAYGAGVDQLWETCEVASAVYEDRFKSKARTNERNDFKLGVKSGLSDVFAGLQQTARQTIAELDHNTFRPSFDYGMPRMAA